MADQKEGNVGMTKEQKFLTFIPLAGVIIYLVVHALAPTAPTPATFAIQYSTLGITPIVNTCQATPIRPTVPEGSHVEFYAADNHSYTITFKQWPFTEPQEEINVTGGGMKGPYTAKPVPATAPFDYTLRNDIQCGVASPLIGIIIQH